MNKLLILFCLWTAMVFSQQEYKTIGYSLKYKNGFLAAHRGTMSHLSVEKIHALEFGFVKRVGNEKTWGTSLKNPYFGVNVYVSNLGNKSILGSAYGLYAYLNFPFVNKEKFVASCKISAGLGGITKVYDLEKNPTNSAMGSHLNALLVLGLDGYYYINSQTALNFSCDMTHLSNAATKMPNLGVNMPMLGLGIISNFKGIPIKNKPQTTTSFGSNQFSVIGIASKKELYPINHKAYPIFALNLNYYHQFRPKVGLDVSIDLMYKTSIFGYRPYITKTPWDVFQIGAYVGYSLPLNRMRIYTGMGRYLKDKFDQDDEYYHRVGFKYLFDSGLVVHFGLKSHWAAADYVETGIGYTFNYKKNEAK